ncbi:MAG: methyl-accepting chemotaxis protein [Allorhizobium sp.]
MARPSIKTSLIAIFATIALISAAFAWLTFSSLSSINASSNDVARNWLPSVKTVKEIQAEIYALRIAYLTHVTSTTPEAIAVADTAVNTAKGRVAEAGKRYEPLSSSDRERVLLTGIMAGAEAYEKRGEQMTALSSANKNAEALAVLALMRADIEPIIKDIDALVEINLKGAEASVTLGDDVFASAVSKTYAIVGLVLLIVIASSIYAISSVAKPIERITNAMKLLAAGDTASPIPFSGRADEIGSMAAAVDVFRAAAIENTRMAQAAEDQRRVTADEAITIQRVAEENSRAKLLEATSALAIGMQKLAAGDLTYQIREAVTEDFVGLRDDFNASVQQLRETLSAVATATKTIDSGTREISAGADDLSKRTEQQAASLEETAAALDQITVNVSNSFKRAQEARDVATEAKASAVKSGQVVAQAVNAMSRIEGSSTQISNIIGVIDEIAFQTNLLALNAGVEAARAGEAGKGFAVVAQEVRELAQRSAQAAKEIKALIHTSAGEVQTGVTLVRDTGTALTSIEELILVINEHMNAIATSAGEQSSGLSEVNTAVNQMDQVTQQNAAMVEESTAASASLAVESARLSELISSFVLGQAMAAPSARAPAGRSFQAKPAAEVRRLPAARGNTALKTEEWTDF